MVVEVVVTRARTGRTDNDAFAFGVVDTTDFNGCRGLGTDASSTGPTVVVVLFAPRNLVVDNLVVVVTLVRRGAVVETSGVIVAPVVVAVVVRLAVVVAAAMVVVMVVVVMVVFFRLGRDGARTVERGGSGVVTGASS